MSSASLSLSRNTTALQPKSRPDKRTLVTGMLAFVAALAVVAWFGISGFQPATDEDEQAAPRVIYAGGAPIQAAAEDAIPAAANEVVRDDEYVIGEFGDPVEDLYADESAGDWGEAALESASRPLADSTQDGWSAE